MDLLLPLIPYIVAALSGMGGVIGGMWAGRKGYMSEAVASQDRVIAALKMQVDLCREDAASLKDRVKVLEQERTATRYVLKREGCGLERRVANSDWQSAFYRLCTTLDRILDAMGDNASTRSSL